MRGRRDEGRGRKEIPVYNNRGRREIRKDQGEEWQVGDGTKNENGRREVILAKTRRRNSK